MAVIVDPNVVGTSTVLPIELPAAERLRLAHRRRRRDGARDLLGIAGFALVAVAVVAIALFSLLGR